MPIHVRWYDAENHIWLQEFEGQWTLEEYDQAFQATYGAVNSVEPLPAYVLSVIVGPLYLPHGVVAKLHQASLQVLPNERLHVIVGGGLIVRSLHAIPTVQRLNPHVRLASSLEEGLSIIQSTMIQHPTREQMS